MEASNRKPRNNRCQGSLHNCLNVPKLCSDGPCGREARALPNLRRFFEPARWRTRAMSCGFTHYALGSRSRGIGDRLTLTFSRRVSSSSLSLLDRAMNAEPAHAKPRSSARASKASNAPVLRSRSVPMMTKKLSVKHLHLSHVLHAWEHCEAMKHA